AAAALLSITAAQTWGNGVLQLGSTASATISVAQNMVNMNIIMGSTATLTLSAAVTCSSLTVNTGTMTYVAGSNFGAFTWNSPNNFSPAFKAIFASINWASTGTLNLNSAQINITGTLTVASGTVNFTQPIPVGGAVTHNGGTINV